MSQKFVIIDETRRSRAMQAVATAEVGTVVTLKAGDPRTVLQNRKMWPMLTDISEQLTYHGFRLDQEEWKDVFSCSLSGELRMVPTLDNKRVVLLGLHTSKQSKKWMSDMIELMYSYGSQKGVVWSEKVREQ